MHYPHGGFHALEFYKKGSEIVRQANKKAKWLKGKIKERQSRVDKICKSHGMTATDFFGNLDQFTNSTSNSYQLQAGEMSQLQTEATIIKQEKEELTNVELLARNLDKRRSISLHWRNWNTSNSRRNHAEG